MMARCKLYLLRETPSSWGVGSDWGDSPTFLPKSVCEVYRREGKTIVLEVPEWLVDAEGLRWSEER